MTQTVLRYGKASQQRIAPYIVISKRRLSNKEQFKNSSLNWFKPVNQFNPLKRYSNSIPNDGAGHAVAAASASA